VARRAAASAGADIVGIGPVGVSLTGLDPAWRSSLALALGPLPPATGATAVRVEREAWSGHPPGAPVPAGPDLDLHRAGDELDVHDRRSGVRARLVGSRVLLSCAHGPAAPTGRVIPFALAPPLLDAGVALVHAATVAEGDRAVLVVGATGAGKSTMAAAARLAGLRVHGDDLAALGRDGDDWWVRGLARPVRVPAELALGAPAVADDRRRRVEPPGWAEGGQARLVAVALVGHGDDPVCRPADGVAVARAVVAASFATGLPSRVAPSMRIAAALARSAIWDVRLAADPDARLAAAGAALRIILG